MKKVLFACLILALTTLLIPTKSYAAAGIYASGGGEKTVGQTFTVTISASGGEFDSLQGTISVSGPVDVVSFLAGSATWLPGKSPANGSQFVGIISPTSSLTVAAIKLKGRSVGSGSVSLSGAKLARNGAVVSTTGGSTSFTIQKAPDLPGSVSVSSSTHPDQNVPYEATTVSLSWTKASNVKGFSYLLDQTAGTAPPSTVTNTSTSATYENQAVGTYYFHIKAQSSDGWGPVTHFKVTIKEPDPKINTDLGKPSGIKITAADNFINDIVKGTFSGFKITGVTAPNFTANIKLDPAPTLPEGKSLSAKADASGIFELLIDFPIASGHYTMTVQGQDSKILTPVSDPVFFEISQSKGGMFNMLTEIDSQKPIVPIPPTPKWSEKINFKLVSGALGGLLLLSIAGIVAITLRNKRDRGLIRHLKSMK